MASGLAPHSRDARHAMGRVDLANGQG